MPLHHTKVFSEEKKQKQVVNFTQQLIVTFRKIYNSGVFVITGVRKHPFA
jgi:hypothetical protein